MDEWPSPECMDDPQFQPVCINDLDLKTWINNTDLTKSAIITKAHVQFIQDYILFITVKTTKMLINIVH